MILARPDLELLHRRVLMRAIPGFILCAALAFAIAGRCPERTDGFFWLFCSGLVIGLLTAVVHRWRMESDLLERNLAIDIPWFAIPLAAVAAMASPWAARYWDVATLVMAARAVLTIQEIVTEWTLHGLLSEPSVPEQPSPRRLPQQPLPEARLTSGMKLLAVDVNPTARCPVCADEIEEEQVRCVDCQTPHHKSCFEYNGRCGVYGCGGSQAFAGS